MKATHFLTTTVVFSSLVLGGLAPAQAANLIRSWDVSAALSEAPFHNSNHNHVAWMPHIPGGSDFIQAGDITFNEFDDGTARLFGSVVSETDADKQWDFNVWFEGASSTSGTGGPKKELTPSSYVNNGGPIDPSTWYYYDFHSTKASTFTGVAGSFFDGKSFEIDDFTNGAHRVQVGYGANGKNDNRGLSTWFKYEGDYTSTGTQHGDFNIDLIAKSVPEPATLSFLSLGFLSLGMGALKRKNG